MSNTVLPKPNHFIIENLVELVRYGRQVDFGLWEYPCLFCRKMTPLLGDVGGFHPAFHSCYDCLGGTMREKARGKVDLSCPS